VHDAWHRSIVLGGQALLGWIKTPTHRRWRDGCGVRPWTRATASAAAAAAAMPLCVLATSDAFVRPRRWPHAQLRAMTKARQHARHIERPKQKRFRVDDPAERTAPCLTSMHHAEPLFENLVTSRPVVRCHGQVGARAERYSAAISCPKIPSPAENSVGHGESPATSAGEAVSCSPDAMRSWCKEVSCTSPHCVAEASAERSELRGTVQYHDHVVLGQY
jgi:hypothetical protein